MVAKPWQRTVICINLILKIDGISAAKTAIICESLRELPKSINSLHDEGLIWLDRLEENARVINIRVFSNNIDFYENSCEQLNIEILSLLEKEGINTLHLEFRTYLGSYNPTLERAGKSIN
ncbi:hypothetical protein [Microcoleus sp. OTE_8_concoct_300]|uniref:hypothetical protein n=1 Tax=Microcoleus sp. OTE_8_concoct_300 TaxID=2964710 RepID=UPI00403F6290